MQESVAQVMRHSSKEAKKTYDRRTATQRKRQGLDLIAKMSSTPNLTSKKRLSFGSGNGMEGEDVEDLEETPFLQDQRALKSQKMDKAADQVVVEFDHYPHAVIRKEGDQVLLAPMQRSSLTNAPVYFVAPTAHFFPADVKSCKSTMKGKWNGREFTLI